MAYRNVLFGFTGRQQIQIPLAGRQESFLIPFGSELCGEVHVKVEKAVCYDLSACAGRNWNVRASRC